MGSAALGEALRAFLGCFVNIIKREHNYLCFRKRVAQGVVMRLVSQFTLYQGLINCPGVYLTGGTSNPPGGGLWEGKDEEVFAIEE